MLSGLKSYNLTSIFHQRMHVRVCVCMCVYVCVFVKRPQALSLSLPLFFLLTNIPLAMQIEEGANRAGRGLEPTSIICSKTPVLHNLHKMYNIFLNMTYFIQFRVCLSLRRDTTKLFTIDQNLLSIRKK